MIRIGRKSYKYAAIKAQVDSPVLGWDFVRFHKLNFIWNNWGDLTINDPRAKITSVLKYKSIPYHNSRNHQKLSVISHSSQPPHCPRGLPRVQAAHLAAQIASLEAVDVEKKSRRISRLWRQCQTALTKNYYRNIRIC